MKFVEVIGTFNSKLILLLAIFLFLMPLALLYRIFDRNTLSLKPVQKAVTLFVTCDYAYTKGGFEKM